jgi:parallel beta-helix repeat protein
MRRLPLLFLLAGCATRVEFPRERATPIRLEGSGVVYDFGGAELVGPGAAPDEFQGTAIVVDGGRDVTIRNVKIRGFKVAIHATGVERLTIENCDLSGNWRQRLNSTLEAEAPEDWLYGHQNDDNEWLRYGAAIYLDRCPDATIRNNVGRNGQNGVCITRSDGARIYDNDFSFNSGWGLAMYRSSRCTVSRNKFDWCIRGYSHGVYSRGQDSTGILVYEQCSDNVFAYNSATHGGDGFFLWAGHETLDVTGEGGCNNNLLYRNDFSHAAANGIEATFSVGNKFIENRIEECDHGIWAGYSTKTLIAGNFIARNANGISIEHGSENRIEGNAFHGNGVAVNLWWDEDPDLFKTVYGQKRNVKSENYVIKHNTFRNEKTALRIRQTAWPVVENNNFVRVQMLFDADGGPFLVQNNNFGDFEKTSAGLFYFGSNWWKKPPADVASLDRPIETSPALPLPPPRVEGSLDAFLPAGSLRGRKHIFVDEWGPRDPADPKIAEERAKQAVNLATGWKVTFHAWESMGPGKPPANWEAVAASAPLEIERADRLDYRWPGAPVKSVPADFFATVATTEVELEAGDYELRTVSDDGIRVFVDSKIVIEDWTWHSPTSHAAKVTLSKGKHSLKVEHFEIDGYAQLSVRLRPSR